MYLNMSEKGRKRYQEKLLSHDLRGGRKRVMNLINSETELTRKMAINEVSGKVSKLITNLGNNKYASKNTLVELRNELNELKASALKDGALTEYVELIRTLEENVKELETKVTDLLNNK